MRDLKLNSAVFIAKLTRFLTSTSKSGGTAAPGLLALKIDPNLVKKLSQKLTFSIVISGTNGKTTTSRMLAAILTEAKINAIHNRAGSNLMRGIASRLLSEKYMSGKIKDNVGLWEVDEAVLPEAIENLKPKVVVLTNLFRDQLDRYGEIDTLAKKWQKSLSQLNNSRTIILNADDPTLGHLGSKLKAKVIYFGINDQTLGTTQLSHASDATLCPKCLRPLVYEVCFISHLGIYHCPQCHTGRPRLNVSLQKAIKAPKKPTNILSITANCHQVKINLEIPGIYNLYNVLTAYAVSRELNVKENIIQNGLSRFKPAFGRFEKININSKNLHILLVKNPTGLNEVIKVIAQLSNKTPAICLLALNDLIADGRDVSWIWDADLENLKQAKLNKLIITGTRAWDLALRLKYGDWNQQKVFVETDLQKAVNTLIKQNNNNLFIIPTYTAMLAIRKILTQMKLVKSSWED